MREHAQRAMKPMRHISRTKNIDNLMTAEQVATALAVSVATVWRMRSEGLLTGRRVLGRTVFDRFEVEATQRKRRQAAAG
jgi:predicted DNA-binding transcriptional regulator AlpA